jgi:hypothetical protein
MTDIGWLIAGGAAISGTIGMFWNYIKSLWAQLSSRVVVTTKIDGQLNSAVNMYVWQHFKPTKFGQNSYTGWSTFVRPVKRVQLIAMESFGEFGKLFWHGWRPLWLSQIPKDKNQHGSNPSDGMKLTFLRGTFNLEKLILAAVSDYNHIRAATDSNTSSRYRVIHVFGTANKVAQSNNGCKTLASASVGTYDAISMLENRILEWNYNDLGNCRMNHGNALGQQALSPEAADMVAEIKRWKTSEDWYKTRGIPWRRGWRLEGPPGTGKTSLIRAIAEDLDLPIFVFDLATLYNDELQEAWQKMLENVPCIALIEDIDAVFDGRENKVGGHLTFDSLLNCLDGVERADGILLVITTNYPDKLDNALSDTRPGRIDRVLKLHDLNRDGRYLLCSRILKEWPELWNQAIEDGAGETGAQFQERLTQIALHRYWRDSA